MKTSSVPYNPLNHSIVQAFCGGTWQRYQADDFHEALLTAIQSEIERVYWNRHQEQWDSYGDPEIPGIHWQSYVWNCSCPAEFEHLAGCIATQPNFKFEDVEINWYKYPGRGMSVNQDWDANKWREWFDRCLTAIRVQDTDLAKGVQSETVTTTTESTELSGAAK